MSPGDWKKERQKTSEAAREACEGCLELHFLAFGPEMQAHHVLGRGSGGKGGGSRRDDRLWKPLQTIESEPNLARWRWLRNLKATCFAGHERLEKMSTKAYRWSLLEKKCQCGLLLLESGR